MDKASIHRFVTTNPLVRDLDLAIAALTGDTELNDSAGYADSLIENVRFVGLESIEDVQRALDERRAIIPRFADGWLKLPVPDETDIEEGSDPVVYIPSDEFDDEPASPHEEGHAWSAGVSLLYLCYVVSAERGYDAALEYLRAVHIGGGVESNDEIARQILRVYADVKDD